MKKLLFLMLFTPAAFAAHLTVKWTNPTTYDDGSALLAAALTQTRIEWGSCSGTAFGTKQGEVLVPAPALQVVIPGFARNRDVCLRGYSKTTEESVASNVVKKWIPPRRPNAPSVDTTVLLRL